MRMLGAFRGTVTALVPVRIVRLRVLPALVLVAVGILGCSASAIATASGASSGDHLASASDVRPTVTSVTPNSGPATGGTQITITGSGFHAGAKVLVGQGSGAGEGAIPATDVTTISATEITAVTGAGNTGTWGLYVTTTAGTSTPTSGARFTYTLATRPTVTSVTPNSGPATGGTEITITGSGFHAGAKVLVGQGSGAGEGAIPATDVTTISATEIIAVTGVGNTGTWGLYVTTTAGTSTPTSGARFTYTLATRPTVTSVTPNSGPATGGTQITITGSGFHAGAKVLVGQGSGAGEGAIPATDVTTISATEITAVTGAGNTGTWGLYVTTTAGTSTPSRVMFSYL